MNEYSHYFKALPPGCTHVDVYRVLELFGVVDPPIQHAVKKLLCAGERGNKTMPQDIAEAIATLQRWQQMRLEEATPVTDFNLYTSPDVWTSQPEPASEPTLRDDVERIRAVFAELPREHLDAAMDRLRAEREEDPEADPSPAPAPDDAERAAYLERWKDAPDSANWLAQDPDGWCTWFSNQPKQVGNTGNWWATGNASRAGDNLLGSVRCEPRPTPAGGQGVWQ